MVNNLRTDKAQVLVGSKQHKAQLIIHEARIVIARLADFCCVCVCVLQAKVWESPSVLWLF
jgi:hypothetical protein